MDKWESKKFKVGHGPRWVLCAFLCILLRSGKVAAAGSRGPAVENVISVDLEDNQRSTGPANPGKTGFDFRGDAGLAAGKDQDGASRMHKSIEEMKSSIENPAMKNAFLVFFVIIMPFLSSYFIANREKILERLREKSKHQGKLRPAELGQEKDKNKNEDKDNWPKAS